jgi:hypothetical protein
MISTQSFALTLADEACRLLTVKVPNARQHSSCIQHRLLWTRCLHQHTPTDPSDVGWHKLLRPDDVMHTPDRRQSLKPPALPLSHWLPCRPPECVFWARLVGRAQGDSPQTGALAWRRAIWRSCCIDASHGRTPWIICGVITCGPHPC